MDIFRVTFGFLFDSLTCTMLLIIIVISTAVHFYSLGYMSMDPHLTRFLAYLSLFTFFMEFLVASDNFLQMFIGWEGVGLCSYLLINFWHTRLAANKAALKAMAINRLADIFFMFGIILIFSTFKTLDFVVVFAVAPFMLQEHLLFLGFWLQKIDLICFFLFIGAVGKSAQLGLHVWLPDAMEGPTPVSALLHAATMVTAGIFLVLRCSPLFEHSPSILFFISIVGALTACFFSLLGAFQYDIKKIVAYSTCSQLGYMFFSCGLSNYQLALFHLCNHAFFKALLFLSAGAVIHALGGEQDIRKMGALVNFLPFTFFCFLVGSLALIGFPFLTGFYSKDLILELTYSRYLIDGNFIYWLSSFAAFFTALYSARLLFFVFFHEANFYRALAKHIHEGDFYMSSVLAFLCFLSIFAGYLLSEGFLGWGTYYWSTSLYVLPKNFTLVEASYSTPLVKNMPFFSSLAGVLFFFLYEYFFVNSMRGRFLRRLYWLSPFFFYAGFFNAFFNAIFINLFRSSYTYNTKILDKGFLELFGPHGLRSLFWELCNQLLVLPPFMIFLNVLAFFIILVLSITGVFLYDYESTLLFIGDNFDLFMFIMTLFFFDLFFDR